MQCRILQKRQRAGKTWRPNHKSHPWPARRALCVGREISTGLINVVDFHQRLLSLFSLDTIGAVSVHATNTCRSVGIAGASRGFAITLGSLRSLGAGLSPTSAKSHDPVAQCRHVIAMTWVSVWPCKVVRMCQGHGECPL